MTDMNRVTADQLREAANNSGVVLTGADVYALADNLTAILIRDGVKAPAEAKAVQSAGNPK